MKKIYNSCFFVKVISVLLVYAILYQCIFPTLLFARSGSNGTQQEGQNYMSPENTEHVNLFTGDFLYNVPLLEIEGYPINLSYTGEVGMNDDASWVGLGWNCTPGMINRQIKGVPDDFNGDLIQESLTYNTNAFIADGYGKGRYKSFFFKSSGKEDEKGSRNGNYGYATYNSFAYSKASGLFKGKNYDSKSVIDSKLGTSVFLGQSFWKMRLENPIQISTKTKETYKSYSSRSGGTEQTASGESRQTTLFLVALAAGIFTGFPIPNPYSRTRISQEKNKLEYGSNVYTPSLLSSQVSQNFSNKLSKGFYAVFWTNYSFNRLAVNAEAILNKSKDVPAYGYVHLEKASAQSISDFNKIEESVFIPGQNLNPNLLTYDVFSCSAYGLSADFRAHRSDIGTLSSPNHAHISVGSSYDKMKLTTQKKLSQNLSPSADKSGKWDAVEPNKLSYTGDFPYLPTYEKVYFKESGETNVSNHAHYQQYGGDQPCALELKNMPMNIGTTNKIKIGPHTSTSITTSSLPASSADVERKFRNKHFSFLNASESDVFAIEKNITDYSPYSGNSGSVSVNSSVSRTTKPVHHFSEISVTNEMGNRFVYGIPIYNNLHKDVHFNTSETPSSCSNPLVEYITGENSINNQSGDYDRYSSKSIPQYATGYLLSAVLSDDYIDLTENGPSEDDYGNYTKFNYSKVFDSFKWRSPMEENKAYFNENSKALGGDDAAFYSYGEKEMWFLHSVESKNYVAEFYLENRVDAFAVNGENGGMDVTKPLKRLKKIELYNKHDRKQNGSSAIPIKTVHFEYDYSLCPNYTGNSGATLPNGENDAKGKLTLKRVYVTYGRSQKGKLSAYEFQYNGANPDYNRFATDRWGSYRPNDCNLTNIDFPYALQNNVALSNTYAAAFRLTDIVNPEGGKLSLTYESDDYAYVQDKQAGQMFKIIGTDDTPDDNFTPPSEGTLLQLYSVAGKNVSLNNVLYFQLQEPLTLSTKSACKSYLESNYLLHKGKKIYFNVLSKLGLASAEKDRVNGYVEVEDYGVIGNASPYAIGWIKIKNNSSSVNHIIFSSLQYLWAKNTQLLWEGSLNAGNKLDYFLSASINFNTTITVLKNLILYKLISDGAAKYIHSHYSWLRLSNPEKKKLGGGVRVKNIQFTDNWYDMGGNYTSNYEIEYQYVMQENGKEISSGVAQQEPLSGYDESSLIVPLPKRLERKKINYPDEYYDQETPMNPGLYNAPTVGYRQVKVINKIDESNFSRNASGYKVYKFYTSYDFPDYIEYTEAYKTMISANMPNNFAELYGISQGFVFHRNNMHGKARGVESYNAAGALTESTEVAYKTSSSDKKRLAHEVQCMNYDGTLSNEILGKQIEAFHTSEVSQSLSVSLGVATSRTLLLTSSIGIHTENDQSAFYSSNFTKVIDHFGIIDRIDYFSLGAKSTVRSVAFDKETGNTLVYTIEDEYKKFNTVTNVPAYWAYEGMAPAARNYRNKVSDFNLFGTPINLVDWNGNGEFILTLPGSTVVSDYFMQGDEILITEKTGSSPTLYTKAWVYKIDDVNDKIVCIDAEGQLYAVTGTPDTYGVHVIRPARRNLQAFTASTVSSLKDATSETTFLAEEIINSNAIEFSENWKTTCAYETENCEATLNNFTYSGAIQDNSPQCGLLAGNYVNPYMQGILGIWRPKAYWTYNAARITTTDDISPYLRKDGHFDTYAPFWEYNTGQGKLITIKDAQHTYYNTQDDKWRKEGQIDEFSPYGKIRQLSDILNRKSAVVYAYNPVLLNLPVGVASNAGITEIACDNFEDYAYLNDAITCDYSGHMNFMNMTTQYGTAQFLDNTQAHTGKFSIKISAGNHHGVARVVFNAGCESEPNTGNQYELQDCDCHRWFSPVPEKEYVLSAWVREQHNKFVENYQNAYINVSFNDVNGTDIGGSNLYASGQIIEGWQKIEEKITIPAGTHCIIVSLYNPSGTGVPDNAWFDDFRMHPANASMTTMVYDPNTLRIVAELDAHNYATFYQYDNEGKPVRMNIETESGIKTVVENRNALKKNNE